MPVFSASKAQSLSGPQHNCSYRKFYKNFIKKAGTMACTCNLFYQLILGMASLKLEKDQKVLVSLLGRKSLDKTAGLSGSVNEALQL